MTITRINTDIPNDVHRRAKIAAATLGLTLRDFLIQALDEAARAAGVTEKKKGK